MCGYVRGREGVFHLFAACAFLLLVVLYPWHIGSSGWIQLAVGCFWISLEPFLGENGMGGWVDGWMDGVGLIGRSVGLCGR